MDRIFKRLVDSGFSELGGLSAEASVPVPQALINEILRVVLEGNKQIESIRVSIGTANRVSVDLKVSLLPWPLNLKLRLEEIVDIAPTPTVKARLENKLLLGMVAAFLKGLPDGIVLSGDRLAVHIAAFLRRPEHLKALGLVRSAKIGTLEGKAILDLKIEVT